MLLKYGAEGHSSRTFSAYPSAPILHFLTPSLRLDGRNSTVSEEEISIERNKLGSERIG